jgi:uncharacterized ferritin-like protein (DUF455 family)
VTAAIDAFCQRVLSRGDLEAKLESPPMDASRPSGSAPVPAPETPARDPGLALRDGVPPLPRPGDLADPAARAASLARFAHHELQAVELLAWALLRWPDAPAGLRRDWLGVLRDEQRHCLLYRARLQAHGSDLGEHPCSGYFWRQREALGASPEAFLAGMGLTLEQANLDFTLLYRDAFRRAGDPASAAVCQRVHDDEVEHVRTARRWLLALRPDARDDVAAYDGAVRFPLSAARAKGRRFDLASRRRAGLSDALIEHVRAARSSQQARPGCRARGPGAADAPPR